jgi:predicted anti-sigma-YlaC factor YlaD
MLPAFGAAFALGAYMESKAFANATQTAKETTTGLVIVSAIIACLILCAITRSRKQQDQKSGGFGYATRTNGR